MMAGLEREVTDKDAPSLYNCQNNTIVDYENHNKKLWLGFSAIYAVFFSVTVVFVYLAMNRAPLLKDQFNNGDYLYTLVLIANVPGLIMSVLLSCFFIYFRNTPEVKSRLHIHLIHFCTFAVLHASARLYTGAVRFDHSPWQPSRPFDPNAPFSAAILAGKLLLFFTSGGVLASLVCRLGYMYLALRDEKRGYQPKYWVLMVACLLLFIPCMFPYFWCNWHTCNMQEKFSGFYVYMGGLTLTYLVLVFKTREADKNFNDLHSNIRIFIAFCITFWIPVIIVNSNSTPRNLTQFSYMGLFLGPYLLWMFILDSFALVIIRVISRHVFHVKILEEIDLEGEYYRRMECLGTDLLQMIKDPELLRLILAHANSPQHLCGENILFLDAINSCKQTESTDPTQARQEWLEIVKDYIAIGSVNEVNLVSRTRNKILEAAGDESEWKGVNWAARAPQMEVNYNLTQSWLPAFMKSQAYEEYRETQLKEVEDIQIRIKRRDSRVQNPAETRTGSVGTAFTSIAVSAGNDNACVAERSYAC